MKIQYLSDLHFEFWPSLQYKDPNVSFPIADDVEVLVLAGDICSGHPNQERSGLWLLKRWLTDLTLSRPDLKIIYVLGNHEFYYADYQTWSKELQKELSSFGNLTILENDLTILEEVAFIGATLYTPLTSPLAEVIAIRGMNDFRVVTNFDVRDWKEAWEDGDRAIRQGLNFAKKHGITKTVVVSHFTPSYMSEHEMFKGEGLGCCFHNRYDGFLADDLGPDYWIHGHTHTPFNYSIGKTTVLCNPLGYVGSYDQNKEFNPVAYLEV